jgi:hypothetical protein
VCDVSCDITPLLTSLLSSEGPNVRCAIGVGHPGVVVGDTAYSSHSAALVWDTIELFLMPIPITEEALVDPGTITHGVPASLAPLASFVVLLGPVLPPIREVVKSGVEHGSWDVGSRQGIMEDAWLETAEGVGASKGSQGVLFFPSCVIV